MQPHTPVQRCTSAFQALTDAGLGSMPPARVRAYGSAHDVALLDAAQKTCNALTPAQAKRAAAGVSP